MSTGARTVTTTVSNTEDPADNVRARCILSILSCVAGSTVSCALVKKEGVSLSSPLLDESGKWGTYAIVGNPPR